MQTAIVNPAPVFPSAAEPLLPVIEKPSGLMMKLVYGMSRRQFGKFKIRIGKLLKKGHSAVY